MKFISKLFVFIFLIGSVTNAQIHNPVSWETSVEKINDSDYNLVITAGIETGWHLYSQNVPEGGPIPTSIKIVVDESKYQLIGSPQEGQGHEEYDNVFDMDIKYFETQAVFKQRIRLLSSEKLTISGVLEFMVCDDTNCLPPTDVDLTFEVQGLRAEPLSQESIANTENSFLQQSNIVDEAESKEKTVSQEKIIGETKKEKRKSLWTLFILSFFAGFAALLTPCVFPMIPMTVSFFTKQSKTRAIGIRNAILYGASIVILYVFFRHRCNLLFRSRFSECFVDQCLVQFGFLSITGCFCSFLSGSI